MYQSLPPDGKLDEAVTCTSDCGRPCQPLATRIASGSYLGISHQSQNLRPSADILSAVNSVVCLSGADSRRGRRLP